MPLISSKSAPPWFETEVEGAGEAFRPSIPHAIAWLTQPAEVLIAQNPDLVHEDRGHWADTPVLTGEAGVDAYFGTYGTDAIEDYERVRPIELSATQVVDDRKQVALDRLLNAFDMATYNESCTCGASDYNARRGEGERARRHVACGARGNPHQLADGFVSIDQLYALVLVAFPSSQVVGGKVVKVDSIYVVKVAKDYVTDAEFARLTGRSVRTRISRDAGGRPVAKPRLYLRAEAWHGPFGLNEDEQAFELADRWRAEMLSMHELETSGQCVDPLTGLDRPRIGGGGELTPTAGRTAWDRQVEAYGDRVARRRARQGSDE